MGNYFNNSDDTKFFETNKKINESSSYPKLDVSPNFNFENENFSFSKAQEIFEKAKKENNIEQKKLLLYESLNYNNTDGDIILEILQIESEEKKNEILKKYGYYLSDSNYKIYFKKDKKSSIELFKELFDLFEKFQMNKLYCIENIWNFVEEFCLTKIRNTFTNEIFGNEELFVYFLLISKEISGLINSIKYNIYYDTKLNFDEKLKTYFSVSEQDQIKELIEASKKNVKVNEQNFEKIKNDLLYVNYRCFTSTFPKISSLVKELKNEIIFCLNNLNDSNFYIFICIKELILNILKNYTNSRNGGFIKKIKNYFLNKNDNLKEYINIFNNKSEIIKIEEDKENSNNLFFIKLISYDYFGKKEVKKILKNANIYDWQDIISNISNVYDSFNNNIPLEYQFLEFIKIEYQYKYNFINYSIGFIEELSLKICKSNTIISLLSEIYPGCEKIFNEKSCFLSNLVKNVLNNNIFLNMHSFRAGTTFTVIKRIYFYFFNRYDKFLNSQQEYKCFLVANLGIFFYIFILEFYGDFLLHYLSLLTKNKYSSIDDKEIESGKFIEVKLFGKITNTLNLSQILFILDINNYKNDFNTFCSIFKKCENFDISKNLSDMFKRHFDIELKFENNKDLGLIDLFRHDIGSNDNNMIIMSPTFNNCVPFNNIDFLYNLEILNKN